MMKTRVSFALLTLGLAACGKPQATPSEGASSAAPPASVAPAATPAVSAPARPQAKASDYSVVAEASDRIAITPMKSAAYAVVGGVPLLLGEGPLAQDPNLLRGIPKTAENVFAYGGLWPESAWLSANNELQRYFDKPTGRWAKQEILRENEQLLAIVPIGERVVAAIAMPTTDIRFQMVSGKGGVIPAPAGMPGATDEGEGCKVKMSPSKPYLMAGTGSGHAFAVGYECKVGPEPGGPMAERWEPSKQKGTVEPLPAPSGGQVDLKGVTAVSGTEAYAFGAAGSQGYLARWDGKAWALSTEPAAKPILAMAALDDGTLFLADEGSLRVRKAGGSSWEQVALPEAAEGMIITGLFARTASDVWVAGSKGPKQLLLRSAKVDKPAVMPAEREVNDALRSNVRWLATPLCKNVYAHLFSIGPTGMVPPKEFPQAKSAFEGKKFEGAKLVVEDDGRSEYVGAKATGFEQADEIVKAFAAANPKAKPRVFCHDPQVKKEIDWP